MSKPGQEMFKDKSCLYKILTEKFKKTKKTPRQSMNLGVYHAHTLDKYLRAGVLLEDVETIQKALNHEADIDSKNGALQSPLLHEAVTLGNTEAVKTLLHEGASLTARDAESHTALQIAVLSKQKALFVLLLQQIFKSKKNHQNETEPSEPLEIEKGIDRTVDSKIRNFLESKDIFGCTVLDWVRFLKWDIPCLQSLANEGSKSEEKSEIYQFLEALSKGLSPAAPPQPILDQSLFVLVLQNQLDLAKKVLELGANINIQHGILKSTLLHEAVRRSHTPMVKYLLERRAKVNAIDQNGQTPLQILLQKKMGQKERELIKLLVQHGALEKNPNALDNFSCAPLHWIVMQMPPLKNATSITHSPLVEFLVKHGASIQTKAGPFLEGHTPLELAKLNKTRKKKKQVDKRSSQESQRISHPLKKSEKTDTTKVAPISVELSESFSSQDSLKITRLHVAAIGGDCEALETLLKQGKHRLDSHDQNRRTALENALVFQQIAAAEYLMKAGASLDTRNHYQHTPLQEALLRKDINTAAWLIQNGASIDVYDCYGLTPQDWASFWDNKKLLTLLKARTSEHKQMSDKENPDEKKLLSKENASKPSNQNEKGAEVSLQFEKMALLIASESSFHELKTTLHKENCPSESRLARLPLVSGSQRLLKRKFSSQQLTRHSSSRKFTEKEHPKASLLDQILYLAVLQGNKPLVEEAIQYGANVNSRHGSQKLTPLHALAKHLPAIGKEQESKEIGELLIKNGATIDAVDEAKQTPLHTAIEWNNLPAALFFIENIEKMDSFEQKDRFQRTPLHSAILFKQRSIREALIRRQDDFKSSVDPKHKPSSSSTEITHLRQLLSRKNPHRRSTLMENPISRDTSSTKRPTPPPAPT